MAIGTVSAIVAIIAAIASTATTAASAGASASAADEAGFAEQERLKREEEQRQKVEKQQKRESSLGGLNRQLIKRRGAEQVAREVPGAKPIQKGAPAAPQSRSITPEAIAGSAGTAATVLPPKTSPNLNAIGAGVQGAADVAGGVIGAVGASKVAQAAQQNQDQISKLEEDEFQRKLDQKKQGINMQGLNFQDKVAAGPGLAAKQNTFATDFLSILRNRKPLAG